MISPNVQGKAKQLGFSLLEILVAFSILALSLGILLKIFSGGANQAAVAEEYTIAVQIAESLMAKTGVETALQPGETTGEEDEKYHWLVNVAPFVPSVSAQDAKNTSLVLYKVTVLVSWGADSKDDRQIELKELRLAHTES